MLTRVTGEPNEPPDPTEDEYGNVYLIPGDFVYTQDALEWLEEYRQDFFEQEFWGWYEDEDKIPQNISWSEFQDFFLFKIKSMIFDTAPEDAMYDEERE